VKILVDTEAKTACIGNSTTKFPEQIIMGQYVIIRRKYCFVITKDSIPCVVFYPSGRDFMVYRSSENLNIYTGSESNADLLHVITQIEGVAE
jgi:hypothetical protein